MNFDVVLLIILIVAGVCFFRRLDSSVYFISSLDIFFRILTFIKNNFHCRFNVKYRQELKQSLDILNFIRFLK